MRNEKIGRICEWARGIESPPFTLDINPTDKCNLRCMSCWQRGFKSIDSSYELPDEKAVDIVKQAIDLGVAEFDITGGGEPMMRKRLTVEIMKLVKSFGRKGNITTNGTLFSDEDIETMVEIGWDRITFSLDGPDAETNDYLRGKGAFEKIMRSIDKLNELKKSRGSKLPAVKFNTVLSSKNYGSVKRIIKLAGRVGCDIVSFEPLTVHSEPGKSIKLNPSEARDFVGIAPDAKKLAGKLGIQTNIGGLVQTQFIEKSNEMVDVIRGDGKKSDSDAQGFASLLCFEPWWHLVIKVDGSAQPCCLYDLKDENVKDKPLKEIWYGRTFQKIREDTIKGKFSKFCSICNSGQVMENRKIGKMLNKK